LPEADGWEDFQRLVMQVFQTWMGYKENDPDRSPGTVEHLENQEIQFLCEEWE